jgi:endonuclease/exonuclease/phosphatase family metal-dependent hydrolase
MRLNRFCLVFAVLCATVPLRAQSPHAKEPTITLFSYNIQVYGEAKSKKPAVMRALSQIIRKADVVAVQEVRSVKLTPVKRMMALLPADYAYVLGPREGRSSSKEQYWFIYNKDKLAVKASGLYPDKGDVFEREPFAVYFTTAGTPEGGDFDFILVDIHVKPSDTAKEIAKLSLTPAYFSKLWNEPDVITVGDFNSDGAYFNEAALTADFPPKEFTILINNNTDTTTAANRNTYDRIIITKSADEDWTGRAGALPYAELLNLAALGVQAKQLSDHFPVSAVFYTDRDTD